MEAIDGGPKIRDGRPLVVGETLKHDGPLVRYNVWLEKMLMELEPAR